MLLRMKNSLFVCILSMNFTIQGQYSFTECVWVSVIIIFFQFQHNFKLSHGFHHVLYLFVDSCFWNQILLHFLLSFINSASSVAPQISLCWRMLELNQGQLHRAYYSARSYLQRTFNKFLTTFTVEHTAQYV